MQRRAPQPLAAGTLARRCCIRSLADTTSKAIQADAKRLGGAVIPDETAAGVPQASRGHIDVDSSYEALNLHACLRALASLGGNTASSG